MLLVGIGSKSARRIGAKNNPFFIVSGTTNSFFFQMVFYMDFDVRCIISVLERLFFHFSG